MTYHREMQAEHPTPVSQMGKSTHPRVTKAPRESYRDQTQVSGGLCTSVHCVFPSDAAFLAREKAKADAECYTAMKMAEANKVNNRCRLAKRTRIWV